MKKPIFIGALSLLLLFSFTTKAQTLDLVTTEWETFTSDGSHSARLNQFVEDAFERAGYNVDITIERPAFAGSGLNTGRYDGQIDFIDLLPPQAQFAYSQPYFPIQLHLISRQDDVEDVRTFSQIRNARVAIENRYASSPVMRLISEIKWSRNPSTFQSIANLADKRSNYLLSDSLMFREFNRLLNEAGKESLFKSTLPLFVTALQVSLNTRVDDAEAILAAFDQATKTMLADGSVNRIFGIAWIVADIDQNGTADFITSSHVQHVSPIVDPVAIAQSAFRWDSRLPTEMSRIIIDGKPAANWDQAAQIIKEAHLSRPIPRTSFLDKNAYKDILRKW